MILKFFFFVITFFVIATLTLLATWNGVIVRLPIEGIILKSLSFELAAELAFYLALIGSVGNIIMSKMIKSWVN